MRAGAAEQVVQGIHTIIIDRVREIVHPDGEELKADSSFAVGFLVSGIMGFVMAVGFAREGGEEIDLEQPGDSACAYLRAVAMQTVETVAQVEGVDTSELLERVSKEADAYRASRATSPDVVKDARVSLAGACRASRGESRDAVITCIHVSRVYRYSSSC